MTDYNSELQILREKLIRKFKLETMRSSARAQLADLRGEEQQLLAVSMREQADVDRLEKPGLASFFYAVLTRKEEKLEKEKAEAFAAAIKHEAVLRQIEALKHDIDAITAEFSQLFGVEARYDEVLAKKAAAVKESNPAHAAELSKIEERLSYIAAQSKEIDEATYIGVSALAQIADIEAELKSAEGWGTWDLLGGGLISDVAKHSHLDDAQARVNKLQVTLRRYCTELSDVTIHADLQAQVVGFLRFADYFFDGLFADWAVLDSIHTSQEQIAGTQSQVESVQNRLEEMKKSLASEAERLKAQMKDVVLSVQF